MVGDHEASAADGAFVRLLERRQFDRLCGSGLTPVQASQLTARLAGLPALGRGEWTYREVQHLVFIGWLAANGRLMS